MARRASSVGVPREIASARPRPPLLRALGAAEPPAAVEIGGAPHRIVRVFKHDSWAATALYTGVRGLVVCKFHRQQGIGRLPLAWLGKLLARRERAMLMRLADLPNVPPVCGDVTIAGMPVPNAVAHDFIPGHPLGVHDAVDNLFFPRLKTLLAEMHRREMAYVDLHKRENILVGDDGRPYLIDFQIGFALADWWLARPLIGRAVLRVLQRSDVYHLQKHVARLRPDQFDGAAAQRPLWIRVHRLLAQPFRTFRRRLLVSLGVRTGRGRVESEHFTEEGLRGPAFSKAA